MLKMAAESGIGSIGGREARSVEVGRRLSRVPCSDERRSDVDLKTLKSVSGGWVCVSCLLYIVCWLVRR